MRNIVPDNIKSYKNASALKNNLKSVAGLSESMKNDVALLMIRMLTVYITKLFYAILTIFLIYLGHF